MKRPCELEATNAKLQRVYADLALENTAIKDVLAESSDGVTAHEPSAHRLVVGGIALFQAGNPDQNARIERFNPFNRRLIARKS